MTTGLGVLAVEVGDTLVEEAEEWCKVSTKSVAVAWEESHVSCLSGWWFDSRSSRLNDSCEYW